MMPTPLTPEQIEIMMEREKEQDLEEARREAEQQKNTPIIIKPWWADDTTHQ